MPVLTFSPVNGSQVQSGPGSTSLNFTAVVPAPSAGMVYGGSTQPYWYASTGQNYIFPFSGAGTTWTWDLNDNGAGVIGNIFGGSNPPTNISNDEVSSNPPNNSSLFIGYALDWYSNQPYSIWNALVGSTVTITSKVTNAYAGALNVDNIVIEVGLGEIPSGASSSGASSASGGSSSGTFSSSESMTLPSVSSGSVSPHSSSSHSALFLAGGPLVSLRDYTHRQMVMYIGSLSQSSSSSGAQNSSSSSSAIFGLIANLYNDMDGSPSQVLIDGQATDCPSFYRSGVLIAGTYLDGFKPMFAISRGHGRAGTWQLTPIPFAFQAITSCYHKGRIILLGYNYMGTLGSGSSSMTCSMTSSSSSGSYGGPNWWCTVGKPLDNGTFTWCCPVSLNLNNPNGVGHVRKRSDGVVEFTWMDNFSNINILRGRGISLNGTGIWQ